MKRKVFIYLTGFLIVLLAVFIMVSIFDWSGKKINETVKVKSSGIDKFRVTDLEYTHNNQFGEKVFSIHIGEFRHKKRKIGPLTINPIKELELNNVHIEFYKDDPTSGGRSKRSDSSRTLTPNGFSLLPLSSALKKTFHAKELGLFRCEIIVVHAISGAGRRSRRHQR